MNMAAPIKHILTAIATVCTIISLSTAHAADEPENIIKFRQNVMKGNGAHITNIAAVVKGQVTITANLAADAQAIADGLENFGKLFPTGTEGGKTNALAKVWDDRAGFDKALADAQAAAENMIGAAASNDIATIGKALGALGKSCGGCHKPYRKKM
ncbi:MAG TPA: cytochrome c [Alphaproteobacteria bacterium]|nr:cytochrome c [Alphaproteobacteria bacterium]HIB19479.1 cytochrome c [Alphaproteobacteria bacterium]HIN93154.1 cytochrome c [Alphaproteobacteria bacterium]